MKIKVSELTGFCFGVKQAVELSKRALTKNRGRVFSAGPIIHNPQVVEELSKKGLKPVGDIGKIKDGTVVVSSHGAGAKLLYKKKRGLNIIDATCPFVRKIQDYVRGLCAEGYKILIIGKREHPEVIALADVAGGNCSVISCVIEAKRVKLEGSKIGIVAQSTYSKSEFLKIAEILIQKPVSEIRVFNTICRDTIRRQDAVSRLAKDVEVMIVVGGKNSANTRRLVEVCKEETRVAYHIERPGEIRPSWLKDKESVGIASGASTPDSIVRDVIGVIHAYGRRKDRRRRGRYKRDVTKRRNKREKR